MDTRGIDWESLRRDHEKLSGRISRFAWERLVILLPLVLWTYSDQWAEGGSNSGLWMSLVTVVFSLSGLYMHVLCKKRQMIEILAAERRQVGVASASPLDESAQARMSGGSAPPTHRGRQIAERAPQTATLTLLVAFIAMIFFKILAQDELWFMGGASMFALYATVYGRYVSQKLEQQAAMDTGHELAPTWVARLWESGQDWARRQMAQLRPRFSLVTGSVLILMTLYLGTAVGSCGNPTAGYTIVTGKWKWPSADLAEGAVGQFLTPITRGMYTLSVLLAGVSLVLVASSVRRAKPFRGSRVPSALAAVSGGISLFMLADYTFFMLYPLLHAGLLWVLWWFVPLSLWYAYGFRRNQAHRERWKRIRAVLIVLYFPVVVFNFIQMGIAIAGEYFGLPVFYFGVHLVTLGYMKLAAQAHAEIVGRQAMQIQLEEMSAKSAAT